MSQPPKAMELQRLTDNGVGGDLVSEQCPVYTSVDVAQSEQKDYLTQQADYTHPGALDPPNEYDIVTDKQRENTSPGYLHQQNNVLYADQFAAAEMKHATLTRTEQSRYIGTTAVQEEMEEPEDSDCSSGCSGRFCLWFVLCAMLIFIALVAIAALVLALLMLLQVIPVCNCAASTEQVQGLVNRIQALESREMATGSNISSLTQRLDTFDVVPAIESAISQRITNNGTIIGLSFTAELVGFEPYAECVTNDERKCTLGVEAKRCETPDLDYIMADEPALNYTRDARCLQLPGSDDRQHVSTTLLIQDNIIFCVCERFIVEPAIAVIETGCALQVTRCRSNRNVSVEIVTTSNAQLGN